MGKKLLGIAAVLFGVVLILSSSVASTSYRLGMAIGLIIFIIGVFIKNRHKQ